MKQTRPPLSKVQRLAIDWRMLCLVVVAVARHLLQMERAGARSAYKQAEALEMQICAALCDMSHQITEHANAPADPGDANALDYLKVLFGLMMVLSYFLRALKHRLKQIGQAAAFSSLPALGIAAHPVTRQQRYAFYDTS